MNKEKNWGTMTWALNVCSGKDRVDCYLFRALHRGGGDKKLIQIY